MPSLLRHPVFVVIITITSVSYLWIYFFYNNEYIRKLGEFSFAIVGFVLSLVWVFKTFYALKKENDEESYFWLFLGLGIVPYIFAWLMCGYYNILLHTSAPYAGLADYLWLLSYLIWVFALIFELVKVLNKQEIIRFLFDILTFMIVISGLIWELLISEIIFNLSGDFLTDFVCIAYPVINLILLFVASLLYYSTRNSNKKTIFTLIAFGFAFQTVADFIYVHQSLEGTYQFGGWIDPLWTLSLLLKGASGLFVLHFKKTQVFVEKINVQIQHHDLTSFGLVAIFISYNFYRLYDHFSFLEYTFFIVIFLVLTKNFILLFQNGKALNSLNSLSKSLEKQVENKTRELYDALNKVEKLALFDYLTGLPNRYMFNEYLHETIVRCKQQKKKLAIMFLDLDRFKFVNDTMGHDTGDFLLKEVSIRLNRSVREGDMIARLGGDEFIILLEDINKKHVTEVAQRIINEFVSPFDIKGKEIYITTSIGISLFPYDSENQEDLITSADKAMYYAKERGKNNYQFYCAVHDTVNRKFNIENGLRNAIKNNEMYLHYQPQVNLNSNQIVGMEALLRWENPELGKITPDEFIPIAEETGLIIPIGRWVLRTVCNQFMTFKGADYSPLTVAVNVSPYQFKDPNFLDDIKQIIQETGVQPELLDLEITENLTQNLKESMIIINELKKIGVLISIDDFGTGYSSLSVLTSLPIDRIKIDRMFINEMFTNTNKWTLVKTIIEMCKNLNKLVVAEGIETEEQALVLKGLNCNIGQGFFYSPPISLVEIEKLIKEHVLLE